MLPFDACDVASIDAALSRVPQIPDIVIHNAGVSQRSEAQRSTFPLFEVLLRTNFLSVAQITQNLLQRKPRSLHIVFVSSIAGVHGIPLRAAYSASKSALHRYCETLTGELSQTDIHCSLVIPGALQTDISKHALQGDLSQYGMSDAAQEKGLSVYAAAKKIWQGIEKKKKRIFVGMNLRHWLLYTLHSFSPSVTSSLLSRSYRRGRIT